MVGKKYWYVMYYMYYITYQYFFKFEYNVCLGLNMRPPDKMWMLYHWAMKYYIFLNLNDWAPKKQRVRRL